MPTITTNYTRIAWDNWLDSATTLTATSEAGNMVIENIQNAVLGLPWRSTSNAVQEIEFDLGSFYLIDYLYISKHNIQGQSKIRLILATDAALSNRVLDREWDALLPVYGLGEGLLGITPLGGYISNSWVPIFSLKWFDTVVARYGKLIITDTSNSDGYIQASRIKIGKYYEFKGNLQYDYAPQFNTTAKQTRLPDGSSKGEKKSMWRDIPVTLNNIEYDTEKLLNEMIFYAGRDRDVLFVTFPEKGTTEELEHTFNGLISSNSGMSRANMRFRTFSFSITELR